MMVRHRSERNIHQFSANPRPFSLQFGLFCSAEVAQFSLIGDEKLERWPARDHANSNNCLMNSGKFRMNSVAPRANKEKGCNKGM